MPRKIAAGNWKMHGDSAGLAQIDALIAAHPSPSVDIVICPPATLLERMARHLAAGPIALGGQTCHSSAAGAHTGDVSAAMLVDAGARYVILGHSERRADHGETDAMVAAQIATAQAAGLHVILCIGESEAAYRAGDTRQIVARQLIASLPDGAAPGKLSIAYEPIWAIGTGLIPAAQDIAAIHHAIRALLTERFHAAGNEIAILYGGSVKPDNAAAIFAIANVDGALVGGASLKAADFAPIIAALQAA